MLSIENLLVISVIMSRHMTGLKVFLIGLAKRWTSIEMTKEPMCIHWPGFNNGINHSILWSACQQHLVQSGKQHDFLRMYWAKKILEWTPAAETALKHVISLNGCYSLDGHDPNGYTGIVCSLRGAYDRAWRERSVFGKIRYLNETGCRSKFDVEAYLDIVFNKD